MKNIISILLSLFILTSCVTYNYEFLEDEIYYIGKTTIPYQAISENSILFVGNNYLFFIDNDANKSKFDKLISKMISENGTFVLYGEIHGNKFRESSDVNFCITRNIKNFDYQVERNKNKNCTYVSGIYYKIDNKNNVNSTNLYKLEQVAKIKIKTNEKSGVNVGKTVLRVPLAVFGLAVMSAANVWNDK